MALEGYIKKVIRVQMPVSELSKELATILNVLRQKAYPETLISETFIVEDNKASVRIQAKEKVDYEANGHTFTTDGRVLIGE